MGIDDIVNKGKELFGSTRDKAEETFGEDKVEKVTDQVFDGATDVAKKISPDQFDDTVDDVRDKADGLIGDEK